MAYIKKPPELVSRSLNLEQPVSELLDDYSRFVECTPDHVANYVLKKLLWRDPEYRKWRAEEPWENRMIRRLLNSKNFVGCLLAAATGMFLSMRMPFPKDNLFFELMFLWARPVFLGFKYSYIVSLYTTPYITYSIALSGLFALKIPQRIRPGRLRDIPDPRKNETLSVTVGEVHHSRKPTPAAAPQWLTIPERGLFTGVAIFGAVGSGKTSCCIYPFTDRLASGHLNPSPNKDSIQRD